MEPANDQTFNALTPTDAIRVNRAGAYRAQLQIRQGHFAKDSSFSAPSDADKATYAAENPGMLGSWFLGRVSVNTLEEDDRVNYPFSSDFKTVSRQALVEARALATQRGDNEIAQAADQLIHIIDGNVIPLNSGVAGLSMKVSGSRGAVSYETVNPSA